MRNVSGEGCRENQNTNSMSNSFSFPPYEMIWENTVGSDRQQITETVHAG